MKDSDPQETRSKHGESCDCPSLIYGKRLKGGHELIQASSLLTLIVNLVHTSGLSVGSFPEEIN
jgi:hypothetical protein